MRKRYSRRRSLRAPGFDYATPEWYFVTICTHGMRYRFGSVIDQTMDDEIRVTVIATGLADSGRRSRRDDRESRPDNVTPIRAEQREPKEIEDLTDATAPPVAKGDDFLSPFEEEYDVPAFIRRARTEEQIG